MGTTNACKGGGLPSTGAVLAGGNPGTLAGRQCPHGDHAI